MVGFTNLEFDEKELGTGINKNLSFYFAEKVKKYIK